VAYTVGTHQLKFGVDYLLGLPIDSGFHADGYYFTTGIPSVVDNSVGFFFNTVQARVPAKVTNFSMYAQDMWRASNRLTLTYGLRWDFNPPPSNRNYNNGNYLPLLGNYLTGAVQAGSPGSSYWDTKYTNFAPRLGVAYQLGQTPGRETVIRGGAGLYYDLGTINGVFIAASGGYPNALATVLTNVPLPISPSQAALPPVNLGNPPAGSTFDDFPSGFASPRSWQWNAAVQQALGGTQSITVSYVAALGRKLEYGQYFPSVGSQQYVVYYTDNSASSDYNSLQVQFQRRLSHGLTAVASYTFGHSLDDSSSTTSNLAPGAYVSPKTNWGSSDFDVRHTFSSALSYDIPGLARGDWLDRLTSGWGLDSILTARSGLPLDVFNYFFVAGANGYISVRPDVVPGQPLYLSGSQCAVFPGANCPGGTGINPAAFAVPANGAQGDFGRNALRGFDLVQVDLSVRRSFRLSEQVRLLFRADLFNVFNHPNFANPDSNLADATFGQSLSMANSFVGGSGAGFGLNSVFQTGGPRLVQFSLKLSF
jgi:TonB dependent receptor